MTRGSRRRSSRRKEGRQGQMTPTSSSMPDQRHTWTMSSVGVAGLVSVHVCVVEFGGLIGVGGLSWCESVRVRWGKGLRGKGEERG